MLNSFQYHTCSAPNLGKYGKKIFVSSVTRIKTLSVYMVNLYPTRHLRLSL